MIEDEEITEYLEKLFCYYCSRLDECCKENYFCPAFKRLKEIIMLMRRDASWSIFADP